MSKIACVIVLIALIIIKDSYTQVAWTNTVYRTFISIISYTVGADTLVDVAENIIIN